MSEKAIYSLVLILYMGLLIIVGLLTSRKLRNVEDFYIGGRNVGPWVTALSYVAAYFSSVVIIGGGGFGYKYGMATLWIGAANVLFGLHPCLDRPWKTPAGVHHTAQDDDRSRVSRRTVLR